MIDIMERLRALDCNCNDGFICTKCEAANEIERLRIVTDAAQRDADNGYHSSPEMYAALKTLK